MKLAAKLVLVLVLFNGALLAVDGFFLIGRAQADFDSALGHDAQLFGRALGKLVAEVWQTAGRERALVLIEEASREIDAPRIRWSPNGPEAHAHQDPGYRYTYVPLTIDDREPGSLEIAEPLAPLATFEKQTILRVLALTGLMVLASTLASIWFGIRMVGQPLGLLIEKVRRVGAGDLSRPVALRGGGEFGELADAVNVMCDELGAAQENMRRETKARIQAVEQLRHSDRLRTVGRLASGMAHELGTPLNVISARAGMIAGGELDRDEAEESAGIIKSQAARMTALIRQLLDFARPSTPRRLLVDLPSLLRETARLVAPLGFPGTVKLADSVGDTPVRANVDASQIQQVLANLVVNALQAMPDGGEVELTVRHVRAHPPEIADAPDADFLVIGVRDAGHGIREEDLPHVFEPFFTTKGVGEGTGLGLSIAHGIVHEHGGWIEATSTPGEGSEFRVYLPRGEGA